MTQAVAYFGVYCWCIVIGGLKLRTEAASVCILAYNPALIDTIPGAQMAHPITMSHTRSTPLSAPDDRVPRSPVLTGTVPCTLPSTLSSSVHVRLTAHQEHRGCSVTTSHNHQPHCPHSYSTELVQIVLIAPAVV